MAARAFGKKRVQQLPLMPATSGPPQIATDAPHDEAEMTPQELRRAVKIGAVGMLRRFGKWGLAVFGVLFVIAAIGVATEGTSEIANAKRAVAARARDPDSVKFSGVTTTRNGCVVGSYNAKNGFGAYTGYQCFHYCNRSVNLHWPSC